jgi:HEAT repeat protein
MSTGQHDNRFAESRPAQAELGTASRSRFRTGLRTMIAVVLCCGVLWWTVQTVLTDNRAAKDAIRAMRSRNPSERVGAIQELEIAGLGSGKIAIPPLIVALGDENARVRTAAAVALGPIGSDTSTSGFDPEAVRAAIMALLGSLKDPEPSVRVAAANALMTLPVGGNPAIIDRQAVMAILVERLGDRDAQTRLAVIQIMAALGPSAGVEPPKEVVAALHDESISIRAMAVVTLASFSRNLDPLIPAFFRMIEDDEPPVGAACAAVLERMRQPANFTRAVVPGLIAVLGRPDWRVRAVACSMLEKLGPEARAAIPALIATAREKRVDSAKSDLSNWVPDRLAIQALGRIAPKTESAGQALAALTELVRAEPRDKWRAAVDALGEFGPAAASAVPELIHALPKSLATDPQFRDPSSVTRALSRIAPGTKSAGQALAALIALLRAGNSSVRMAAADALRGFGPAAASAIPDLIRILEDPNETDTGGAETAAGALGRIAPGTASSGAAVAALNEALRSRSRKRSASIDALKPFGTEAAIAIPQLRTLANDSNEFDRLSARRTLESILKPTEGQE